MKPDDEIRKPVDSGKTGHSLGQTVDSGGLSGESDPDATMPGGDSRPSTSDTSGKFGETIGDWIGPYRLLEEIGSGGMGTVYMAEQREPVTRRVALKIIKAGMDTGQVIARFEAERQALSMMEHPHIARVLDASATETGRPYFVMELVRGLSVTRYCDREKMKIPDRLRLFVEICNAIQHAHQKGIIHRDLKPSNILVTTQDGRPVPKVIDFGVAKATRQRLTEKTMHTQQGQVVGTLEYMSPEQAQMTDANVDTRSDIYSLGVVLYEMLTGETPLNRSSLTEVGYLQILKRIKDEEAPKPSSRITVTVDKLQAIAASRSVEPRRLAGILRGDLDWIVLKALEKEPGRRYETAAGMADDVERYLKAVPINARPPTSWYLIKKFARRHKATVGTAAAILVTLVFGIVLTTQQWIRASNAENTVAEQMVALRDRYKLESEYAELQQEVQRENEAKKAALSSDIRSLSHYGRWKSVLARTDSYATQFGTLPVYLAIQRLRALDGLSRNRELRQEIVRLENMPESELFQSDLKLWRGYAFLSARDNQTNAESLIREAIDGGLDPADRFFAQGLVADSLTDAIGHYREALRRSPSHSQARIQLIVTLTMLGRYEEVQQELRIGETLFPEDPRFSYAETVSHALADRSGLALKSVRKLRQRFPQTNLSNLRALNRLARAVNKQFREYDREGLLDWFTIVREGLPLFQEASYDAIPVPEFQKVRVFKAYGEFANSFLNPLMAIATNRKKHRLMISNCREAFAIHPDGMFKCFEAWSWYALGDFEKSAEAFGLAAESDGLFPEIRNQAVYGSFLSRKMQFERSGDSTRQQQAMESLEKYVEAGFETHRASGMFKASAAAGRWDLAREICDVMIEREEYRFNWMMILLTEAEKHGNYGLALSVCEEMLIDSPTSALLRGRRKKIIQLIAGESE